MAKSSTSFTKKNAAAHGRRGGPKGGRARWAHVSKAERRDHALKMLAARYGRLEKGTA